MPKVRANVQFASRGKPVELETKEIPVINEPEAAKPEPKAPVAPPIEPKTVVINAVSKADKQRADAPIKIEKLDLSIQDSVKEEKPEIKQPEPSQPIPIRRPQTPSPSPNNLIPNIDAARHRRLTQRPRGLPPDNIIKKKMPLDSGMSGIMPPMPTTPMTQQATNRATNQQQTESSWDFSSILLITGAVAAVGLMAAKGNKQQNNNNGDKFDWRASFGL